MTAQDMTLRKQRRNQLSAALAVSVMVGCIGSTGGCSSSVGSRVASMNPFSKSQSIAATPTTINQSPTTITSNESSWLSGPKNVGSSIAGTAKDAATKSRDAVAGWFGRSDKPDAGVIDGDATDPTSLAHKAEVTPEVFVANGRLWESTGNFAKAMESYSKALEKRPNDPEALANIARLHFRQENHTKAAEYFGKAIKEKPDDAGLYNDLGLTLSKLGNHNAAASTIEQALRLSPGSSRYANNLASIKFQGGDPAGALEVLVKNNKPAVAHFNMAYLHYKHGQSAEASRHLTQAIAYEPQAEADAATKRAVERSRELLAQIGDVPGITAGNAIASATKPVSPPSKAATDAATARSLTDGVQQAAQGFGPGVSAPGYPGAVQPASTGNTSVNFGKASYKTPAPNSGVNQTSASTEAEASGSFALPPGFQFPE